MRITRRNPGKGVFGLKRLIILRHATPAASGHDGTDHTRPLTMLGQREAHIQGRFLREAGIIPQQVEASSATRARETAEIIAEDLGLSDRLFISDSLYNAPGEVLLNRLQALPPKINTVLLVAHMPGVAELLNLLTVDSGEMAVAFQPGTLVSITIPAHTPWAELVYGSGTMEWCLPPLLLDRG